MPVSPQLPDFLPEDAEITMTTANHVVQTTQHEMSKIIAFCREHSITTDYYMFEFMEWQS